MDAAFLEVIFESVRQTEEGNYEVVVRFLSTKLEPLHFRRVSLSSTYYFEPTSAAVLVDLGTPAPGASCTLLLVPRSRASSSDTPRIITLDIQVEERQLPSVKTYCPIQDVILKNDDIQMLDKETGHQLEAMPKSQCKCAEQNERQHGLRTIQVQKELEISVSHKRLLVQAGRGDFHYNVVLLGPLDSAKSSFVNSVCTMLSKAVKMVAAVGGGANCSTTRILRYDLSKSDGPNVRLFDTFGITAGSYCQGVSLARLIQGKVPVNASKDDSAERLVRPDKLHTCSYRCSHQQVYRHRMHSAIIFVLAEFLLEPDDLIPEETKQAIDTAIKETTEQKLNPILVLAKADLIKDDLDKQCLLLSRTFGVPRSSVFPFESYVMDNILDLKEVAGN